MSVGEWMCYYIYALIMELVYFRWFKYPPSCPLDVVYNSFKYDIHTSSGYLCLLLNLFALAWSRAFSSLNSRPITPNDPTPEVTSSVRNDVLCQQPSLTLRLVHPFFSLSDADRKRDP